MKYLKEYISTFSPYPDQVILKRVKHGIYYQGKCCSIPTKYLSYYVLDHTRLISRYKVEFVVVEDIDV